MDLEYGEEYEAFRELRRELEAKTPTSDFDYVVEATKLLEAKGEPERSGGGKPKKEP